MGHFHNVHLCISVSVCPQSFRSLSLGPGDSPSITVSPHVSFEAVKKSVSELKERLENVFQAELIKVSESGWWTNHAEALLRCSA